MITEDILITSKDLMKWLNREISEDDEELCMYLSNAVKNQYEYHKEINRLNNIIDELEKWLDEESERTILSTGHLTCLMMCKNKLNELKGDNK